MPIPLAIAPKSGVLVDSVNDAVPKPLSEAVSRALAKAKFIDAEPMPEAMRPPVALAGVMTIEAEPVAVIPPATVAAGAIDRLAS